MSLDSVRAFFAQHAPDIAVIVTQESSATVPLAAAAHGVEPGQIAKTLSLRIGEDVVLVVTRGDARLDNKKAKAALGGKPRMLGPDEVEALTGHRRRRLPLRARHAAQGLLRHLAARFRHRRAGGRLDA